MEPAVILAAFAFVHWIAFVPLAIWLAVCLGFGLWTAIRRGRPQLVLAGVSVMIIHFAWSLGFWQQLLSGTTARREVTQ